MIWSSRRSLPKSADLESPKGLRNTGFFSFCSVWQLKKKLFQMNQVEEKEPTEEKLITELIKSDDTVIRIELKV